MIDETNGAISGSPLQERSGGGRETRAGTMMAGSARGALGAGGRARGARGRAGAAGAGVNGAEAAGAAAGSEAGGGGAGGRSMPAQVAEMFQEAQSSILELNQSRVAALEELQLARLRITELGEPRGRPPLPPTPTPLPPPAHFPSRRLMHGAPLPSKVAHLGYWQPSQMEGGGVLCHPVPLCSGRRERKLIPGPLVSLPHYGRPVSGFRGTAGGRRGHRAGSHTRDGNWAG